MCVREREHEYAHPVCAKKCSTYDHNNVSLVICMPLFWLFEGNLLVINLEIIDKEHLNASLVLGSVRLDCNNSNNLSKCM